MLRRQFLAAVHLLLLASLLFPVNAQETQPRSFNGAPSKRPAEFSGLITSRLSLKELERWKGIERLVFAEDNNQQPLHPTLRNLWEWVETSGHAVFVEIARSTKTSTCTAGSFVMERFDPKGERHIALIKLNLSNIDLAYVGPDTARDNGFIPFEGLSKEERYVEVLGHELAHAVHILTSLDRAKKVEEMVEKTNELLLSRRPHRKENSLSSEMKRMLSRRDALLKDLEKQAEEMEYVVWRELAASKSVREKMSPSLVRQ
ncbi:MAG: hypothetical protein AB7U82_03320 [Blastocatellales bacterium]